MFSTRWIYYNLQCSPLFGKKLKNHGKTLKENLSKNTCSEQPSKVILKNNLLKKKKKEKKKFERII